MYAKTPTYFFQALDGQLFIVAPIVAVFFVFCPCFVLPCLVSFQVLQYSHQGRDSLLRNCLSAVVLLLVFSVSSLLCRGLVCSVFSLTFSILIAQNYRLF